MKKKIRKKIIRTACIFACLSILSFLNFTQSYTAYASDGEDTAIENSASDDEDDAGGKINDASLEEKEDLFSEDLERLEESLGEAFKPLTKQLFVWIPRIGAVMFVLGTLVAIFANTSNEYRKWGIRIAVIGLLGGMLVFFGLHFLYDRVMFDEADIGQKSDYFVDYYDIMKISISEDQASLGISESDLGNTLLASGKLFVGYIDEMLLGLAFFSFISGIWIVFLCRRDAHKRNWSRICLCIIIPLILAGCKFIFFQ